MDDDLDSGCFGVRVVFWVSMGSVTEGIIEGSSGGLVVVVMTVGGMYLELFGLKMKRY